MTEGFAAKAVRGKFRRELWGPFITALKEYELLKEGDRVAVCMSGGKDSALLGVLMDELHRHSDFPAETGENLPLGGVIFFLFVLNV